MPADGVPGERLCCANLAPEQHRKARPAGKRNVANLRPPWPKGASGNPAGSSRKRRLLAPLGYDAFTGGGDAVAFMEMIYRNKRLPLVLRLEAASRVARFQRPALSASLTATIEAKEPGNAHLDQEQWRRRINRLLDVAKLPALAPPE